MRRLLSLAALAISCLAMGQVGDGKADDTQAIQSLIDQAGVGGTVHLAKPARFYRITASLRIGAYHGLTIEGESDVTTRIVMDGDNRPILAFGESHSITVEGLSLEYLRPQNATDHPRSSAICELNEDGKNRLGGLYRHTYRNLRILNATRGFSVIRDFPGDQTSVNPWWGSRWERVWFTNVSRSLVDLNLGNTGAPCNVFSDLLTMKGGNDGLGPAFNLRGEAIMQGLDIEDWAGQLLYAPSAAYILVSGIHVERHRPGAVGDKGRLFEVANCKFDLRGGVFNFLSTSTGSRTIVFLGPNAQGTVDGLTVIAPPSLSVTPTAGSVATNPVSN